MPLRWRPLRTRRERPGPTAAAPKPDSIQRGGFAHWLASYRQQLEELAKQSEPGRNLSEQPKDDV
jgi:hypothetical protein